MDQAQYLQMAASGAAVAVLIGAMVWAKLGGPGGPLDDRGARQVLAHHFPDRRLDALWVASNGAGALARSGGLALVICPAGDGFVVRQMPWAQAVAASFRDGCLRINLDDVPAPAATLTLPSWPPKDLAA